MTRVITREFNPGFPNPKESGEMAQRLKVHCLLARGPRFNFQLLHVTPSVIPVPGDQTLLPVSAGARHAHGADTHADSVYTQGSRSTEQVPGQASELQRNPARKQHTTHQKSIHIFFKKEREVIQTL